MLPISGQVLQDLAPTGKIRVAINYGMPVLAQRDPESGEPRGITVNLANELGRMLQVPVEFINYDAAGKILAAIALQSWDVTFLARDPLRAEQILFTPPYLTFEGTYLVKTQSHFSVIDDLDQPGVRIAVGKGAAYDLYLTRTLKNATLVRADTSAEAVSLFESEELEAAAGVRQPLEMAAKSNPMLRVIPGRFTAIEQAVGTLAGRNAGHQKLTEFIEKMKISGVLAELLAHHNM